MSKTTSTSHSTSSHAQPNENKSNGEANLSCSKNRSKFGKAMRYSTMALAVGAVFVLGGAFVCAPDMSKYEQRSETLYDRAGNIIYTSLSDGDYLRIKTDALDVDPLYIKMLLSSEDERF